TKSVSTSATAASSSAMKIDSASAAGAADTLRPAWLAASLPGRSIMSGESLFSATRNHIRYAVRYAGDIGTGSSENKSRDHDIAVSEPVFHAGNQMEPRLRSGVSGGERYRGKVAVMTPGDLAFFTGMMIGYLAFAGALLFGMI